MRQGLIWFTGHVSGWYVDQGKKVTAPLGEQEGRKLGYRKWLTFFSFPRRGGGENSKRIHFREVPAPRSLMSRAFSQQRHTYSSQISEQSTDWYPYKGVSGSPMLLYAFPMLFHADLNGQKITKFSKRKSCKK